MDEVHSGSSDKEEKFKRLLILSAVCINLLISIYFVLQIFPVYDEEEPVPPDSNISGEVIKAEVLNGSGIPNASAKIADFLRSPKIDVLQTGNYESFDIDETLVIDLAGNYSKAKYVCSQLGLDSLRIVTIINTSRLLDISIIAGKDFQNLKLEK